MEIIRQSYKDNQPFQCSVAMLHSTTGTFRLTSNSPGHRSPWQGACPQPPSPTSLPLLPAATKADRYDRLRRFDRGILRKQGLESALRAPEGVAKAQRKMEGVRQMPPGNGTIEGHMLNERMATCSGAFQDVITATGVFSPLLERIRYAYDQHLQLVLSRVKSSDGRHPRPVAVGVHGNAFDLQDTSSDLQDTFEGVEWRRDRHSYSPSVSPEVYQLRKSLHALEVHCRVALQQNERLRDKLCRETQTRRQALEQLHTPTEEPEASPSPPQDFRSRVEELQRQLVDQQDALLQETTRRSGCVPFSVCRQLEQCLRETEIEHQKLQKRNHSLQKSIQALESQLVKELSALSVTEEAASRLWSSLQEGLVFT